MPRPLQPGDVVAIVAPSGPYPQERLDRGLAALSARGYEVRAFLPPQPEGYLAGTDEDRLAGIHQAFADSEVRAVFAARGGYGAMRLLDRLDWDLLAGSGKPLVGFSDITALHLGLVRHGARSIHGPVTTRLGEEPERSLQRLFTLLESEAPAPPLTGETVRGGRARGRLVGGCLSLLSSLVGTPWFPDLRDCVLFLEEVGEAPYRVDRLLTHLRLSGALDAAEGLVLGQMVGCDAASLRGEDVARKLLASVGKPFVAGVSAGHGDCNLAFAHGAEVELRDGALHFLQGLW